MSTRSVWIESWERKDSREDRKVKSYRVRWRVPGTGALRGETFRTRAEAEALKRAIVAGNLPLTTKLARATLTDYIDEKLATPGALKPKTLDSYRYLTNRWLRDPERCSPPLPALGAKSLDAITPADVVALVERVQEERSHATALAVYRLVRRMLSRAVAEGRVNTNVASSVFPSAAPRRRIRPLTIAQVEALIAATPDTHKALTTLLAYSGLRVGEALALRWESVDFYRGRVAVDATVTELTGQGQIEGTPKSGASRSVAVPRQVVEILREHERVFRDDDDPRSFVFAVTARRRRTDDENGDARYGSGGMRYSTFRRVFLAAVDAAGIFPPPRIHDLRHTAAALAVRAGYHPLALKEMLGHSSITVTLDTYGHLFESLQDVNVNRLSALLSESDSESDVLPLVRRRALPAPRA